MTCTEPAAQIPKVCFSVTQPDLELVRKTRLVTQKLKVICCLYTHTHMHMHTHMCAYTHTHTQPFYGLLDFVRDNPGEPVPEETFTHSRLSWSSVIPYLLPASITIHDILPVHITCLIVFFHYLCKFSFVYLLLATLPSVGAVP